MGAECPMYTTPIPVLLLELAQCKRLAPCSHVQAFLLLACIKRGIDSFALNLLGWTERKGVAIGMRPLPGVHSALSFYIFFLPGETNQAGDDSHATKGKAVGIL